MSYDAPSYPPSSIAGHDHGLSVPAQAQDTIRNLIESRLRDSFQPAPGHESGPGSTLRTAPQRSSVFRVVKRAGDYVMAALLLLLIWPVLLMIAALIRLDSPGPVLFRQERLGLGGRRFWVFKFRTMIVDAEKRLKDLEHLNESAGQVLFKMRRDPRVTRFGAILRRSSLDELPQLFNVLLGQMSLVGPRPLPLRDCDRLGLIDGARFARRHEVPPGLTGLWQVSGRSRLGAEQMVHLDCQYIECWSLWLDLTILIRTVGVVLMSWQGGY